MFALIVRCEGRLLSSEASSAVGTRRESNPTLETLIYRYPGPLASLLPISHEPGHPWTQSRRNSVTFRNATPRSCQECLGLGNVGLTVASRSKLKIYRLRAAERKLFLNVIGDKFGFGEDRTEIFEFFGFNLRAEHRNRIEFHSVNELSSPLDSFFKIFNFEHLETSGVLHHSIFNL